MDDRFNYQDSRIDERRARIDQILGQDPRMQNNNQNYYPPQQPQEVPPQSQQNRGVVVESPKSYEDVKGLIDHLKKGEQIYVNFSNVNSQTTYRVLDFLSGAVYALNGTVQEIDKNIFLFAPSGVTISYPPTLR